MHEVTPLLCCGATATGVNASADVPRPAGSALIPLQHSPQWQWLAARLARSDLSPINKGRLFDFYPPSLQILSPVTASEARQSIVQR
jgi:hypothetical protein